MPSLINLTQNVDPLDHTTISIELTMREVTHLARLLGCTGPEITEALGLYQGNDERPATLYGFLNAVIEEAPVEVDIFEGLHLSLPHDHSHEDDA